MMKITPIELAGAAVVETTPFCDRRGYFSRFFCADELSPLLGDRRIVNINFSHTNVAGAIRGMHFQTPPHAEVKMVRCIRGAVFDVIVDVRRDSKTFLQWFGAELTAADMKMLYVPEGFAHGFQALENDVEMLYLHTEYYTLSCEKALNYGDPMLYIKWPLPVTEVSDKDRAYPFIDKSFEGIKI